jgi:hypothetical protein
MEEINLFFAPDGSGQFLYTEKIDLRDLKPQGLQIDRVSDVEFNAETGKWEAHLQDGRLIAEDISRDVVLQREREVIDSMLLNNEVIPL